VKGEFEGKILRLSKRRVRKLDELKRGGGF